MTNFYTDKQKIINWLDEYEVKNYKLVPDKQYRFVVNVNGDVNLSDKKLINIPVKFSEVKGFFYCSYNKLTSLEFCPQTVEGSFDCSYNKLTSLEFSPQTVNCNFYCDNNKLTSLEFCSQTVNGSFWCNNNKLNSLEFCTQTVNGSFNCNNNIKLKEIQKITDFKLIYLEHKKILINKFSDKLNNNKNKKITKIKI